MRDARHGKRSQVPQKTASATIWIALIAILTSVDPLTPRNAIHATAYAKIIAIIAMNTGPGIPAFIVQGATRADDVADHDAHGGDHDSGIHPVIKMRRPSDYEFRHARKLDTRGFCSETLAQQRDTNCLRLDRVWRAPRTKLRSRTPASARRKYPPTSPCPTEMRNPPEPTNVIHRKAPGAISAIALTVTPVKPSVGTIFFCSSAILPPSIHGGAVVPRAHAWLPLRAGA